MKYLLRNAQNCYYYNYNTYVQRYKIETNYLNAMRDILKCYRLSFPNVLMNRKYDHIILRIKFYIIIHNIRKYVYA